MKTILNVKKKKKIIRSIFILIALSLAVIAVLNIDNFDIRNWAGSNNGTALIAPVSGHTVTTYDIINNTVSGASLIWEYQKSGVRHYIQDHLEAMKADGTDTIRVIVSNMHNYTDEDWGVVPSANPEIPTVVSENLALYFADIKDSGMSTLIVAFNPVGINKPSNINYDSSLIDENFKFIEQVRLIALENGPTNIYFDLAGEISPMDGVKTQTDGNRRFENVMDYIDKIWVMYVNKFGHENASLSTHTPYNFEQDKPTNSMHNLLSALERNNKPKPTWFPVNIYGPDLDGVYTALLEVDSALTEYNLDDAEIFITESYLNDLNTANAVKRFIMNNDRPLTHYVDWFKDKETGDKIALPFFNSAYNTVFKPTSATIQCTPQSKITDQREKISASLKIEVKNLLFTNKYTSPTGNLCVHSDINSSDSLIYSWTTNYHSETKVTDKWLKYNDSSNTYTFTIFQGEKGEKCKGDILASCTVKLHDGTN